jgi:hypothetical protein
VRATLPRRLALTVALAGCLVGMAACSNGGTQGRQEPDVAEVEAQVAQLRLEVQNLRREIATLRDQVGTVTTTAPAEVTATTTVTRAG